MPSSNSTRSGIIVHILVGLSSPDGENTIDRWRIHTRGLDPRVHGRNKNYKIHSFIYSFSKITIGPSWNPIWLSTDHCMNDVIHFFSIHLWSWSTDYFLLLTGDFYVSYSLLLSFRFENPTDVTTHVTQSWNRLGLKFLNKFYTAKFWAIWTKN